MGDSTMVNACAHTGQFRFVARSWLPGCYRIPENSAKRVRASGTARTRVGDRCDQGQQAQRYERGLLFAS
jgi:hypothetical protein